MSRYGANSVFKREKLEHDGGLFSNLVLVTSEPILQKTVTDVEMSSVVTSCEVGDIPKSRVIRGKQTCFVD